MIKFSGMEAKESSGGFIKHLPVGAYVGMVKNVRIEGKVPDQQLAIMLDVSEGDFAGFYTKRYLEQKERSNGQYDVKYKGILRLRIPNPDNTRAQYPETDMRKFNDMIAKFQNSNDGVILYNEDGFDETKLKDLTVGFSTQEDTYNGAAYTKIARLENADDVRNGMVTPMEPRRRDEENPTTPAPTMDQQSGMMQVNTMALPWDDKPY